MHQLRPCKRSGETNRTKVGRGKAPEKVRPGGFEPPTCGLRVRCSAIELEAQGECTRHCANDALVASSTEAHTVRLDATDFFGVTEGT